MGRLEDEECSMHLSGAFGKLGTIIYGLDGTDA